MTLRLLSYYYVAAMSPPLSSSSFISFRRIKYNESSAVELRAGDFIVCGGDAKDSEE